MSIINNAKETIDKLIRYIDSGYSVIYLYTSEEIRTIELLRETAKSIEAECIFAFDISEGISCIYCSAQEMYTKYNHQLSFANVKRTTIDSVKEYLDKNVREKAFVILKDSHMIFRDNPNSIRSFKNMVYHSVEKEKPFTFLLISPEFFLPQEISKEAILIDVPLPSSEEIAQLFADMIESFNLHLSEGLKTKFIEALAGLTESEIKSLINYCLQDDADIREDDIDSILDHKRQVIRKSGVLELVIVKEELDDIGGLEKLKNWIKGKKAIYDNIDAARKWGVDIPKGVLLVGVPGCGKSLAAKAISRSFRVPLLRMDMGLIMGPYLGQSEENIRRAIKLAESISPCILWIDEMEKAFAGLGQSEGRSETSARVFGSILTWMQEKVSPVFVLATANDITGMPPEFLRKGRFDEIFFVDFPNTREAQDILRKHLEKRIKIRGGNQEKIMEKIGFEEIAREMKGFSGADIESVVKEIIEIKFINKDENMVTQDFKTHLKDFKPISKTMGDKLKTLKELKERYKFQDAN